MTCILKNCQESLEKRSLLCIEAFKPIYSINGNSEFNNSSVPKPKYHRIQHDNIKSEMLKGLKSTSAWKNFSTSN